MVDIHHGVGGLGLTSSPPIHHPLEPLTAEELGAAVALVREKRQLGGHVRFVSATLHEPPKNVVLNFKEGDQVPREAFIKLLDNNNGAAYEAIVDLTANEVTSWKHIPGVQPSVMLDEFFECEQLLKDNKDFQAALAKRGVTDMNMVMVDPWSAGYYGLPPEPGNYTPEAVGKMRTDLKPVEITQSEGPSFTVRGHEVTWQKWHLRIGFTPREGLVLHTIGYEDQGRIRPILYRAALAEMVVPYGDPAPNQWRKNAFDVGEYGVGMLANALELGCDCLGEIRYFDAHMVDSRGNVVHMPNTICMQPGWYDPVRDKTHWHHVDRRGSSRRQAQVRGACRTRPQRAESPAYLQCATRYDDRWPK